MKKKSRLMKLIAVILAVSLLSASFGSVTVGASSAYPVISEGGDVIGVIFSDIVDTLLRFILDLFAGLFGNGPGFVPDDEATQELIKNNYFEGTGTEFKIANSNEFNVEADIDAYMQEHGEKIYENEYPAIYDEVYKKVYDELYASYTSQIPPEELTDDVLQDLIAFVTEEAAATAEEEATNKLIAIITERVEAEAAAKTENLKSQWKLGYSSRSLIPSDYDNGTYYIGGYIAPENGFTNVVEGIAEIPGIGKDDMKVRCVAISDATNRGTVLFATIDCIGITNADIKDIRALLADFAEDNNIIAINVASTHTHSCIDTEGLWTKNLAKLAFNGLNSGFGTDEELQQGTNPAYMAFLKEEVAGALKDAFNDMKVGKLTYVKKDIGQDYFQNKNRPSAGQKVMDEANEFTGETQIAMTDIHKFTFTPNDGSKQTIMLNMAAHPDVAGLPTQSNSGREISGDYIFYCGKFLEDQGYNFMFWQGAIAAIYMARSATGDGVETQQRVEESQRFGYELARILLALEMTEEEVAADPLLNVKEEYERETALVEKVDENGNVVLDENGDPVMVPKNEYYTLWYENWNKDEEGNDVIPESVTVLPVLNIAYKQVEIPVSNALIEAVGKLNMANYVVIEKEDGSYSTYTEVAYMEFGTTADSTAQFKTVFMPGEICQDLIAPNGISLEAANSITCKPFAAQAACSIFGDDVMCFGVMNDAIGYVVPDNDYTMGDPANHYHELISLGQGVASALMFGLSELHSEITYA